jgi:putative ABC transport system ATP-binding protein
MRADAALSLVGLGKRVARLPAQLTVTERYLTALARALAKRPALLLCDQPHGSLSSDETTTVMKVLETACAILDTTAVVSTQTDRLKRVRSRSVHIEDGRIVEERPSH